MIFSGVCETICSFLLCAIYLLTVTHAIIPKQCIHDATHTGYCCPISQYNGKVCGGSGRGYCQKIWAPKDDVPDIFKLDERLDWPTRFIHHACQCESKFWGVSCDECWFGWSGPHCERKELRIRKDIRKLSPHELHVFKDVVVRSTTWPSDYLIMEETDNRKHDPLRNPNFIPASIQYYITYMHSFVARSTLFTDEKLCEEYGILNFNHDGPTFPTWHRIFILVWERMLGKIALKVHGIKDYTLPYWDWIDMRNCDICTNKFIGAVGYRDSDGVRIHPGSMFYNMTEYCWEPESGMVCFGCQQGGRLGTVTRNFSSSAFPIMEEVTFIMSRKDYFVAGERNNPHCNSFHMALEGFCGDPRSNGELRWLHNRLHNMIDGSMSSTATATNDPIFILHHTFVDRLFSIWYRKFKPSPDTFPKEDVRPGHARDAFMVGFIPLVRNVDMFTDTALLGYDYDNQPLGFWAKRHRY